MTTPEAALSQSSATPSKFGIKAKLITTFTSLMLGMVAVLTGINIHDQTQQLNEQASKRLDLKREALMVHGNSLLTALAHQIENHIAAMNLSGCHEAINLVVNDNTAVTSAMVMRQSGKVLIHSSAKALQDAMLSDPQSAKALKKTSPGVLPLDNDETRVELVHPLKVSDQAWGVLRLTYSLEELVKEREALIAGIRRSNQLLIKRAVLYSSLFFVIAVCVIWLVAIRITKPIKDLTAQAHLMADGDFSTATDKAGTIRLSARDEVGVLSRTFLTMTQRLQDSYRRLEETIIKQQKANDALLLSETKLRQAQRTAKLGSWELDIPTSECRFSAQAFRIHGIEQAQPGSVDLLNIIDTMVHPSDRDKVIEALGRVKDRASGKVAAIEYRLVLGKGDEDDPSDEGIKWIRAEAEVVKQDNTHSLHGTIQDVTAMRMAEEEKKALKAKLEQAEKMEAIGQLAGGIAHDYNNQLAAVMGFADLLIKFLDKEPTLQDYAQKIKTAAKRSSDLTRQLLAFARKGNYQTQRVDLHSIVDEVVGLLEHTINKNIAIERRLNARSFHTDGDASQIQNALLNLAINARDAMPGGGRIRFSTEMVELDTQAAQQLAPDLLPGAYVCIHVEDSGTGIPDKIQKRIFEPFFTTKAVGEGTGMGLAAVYGTIRNHQGAIALNSEKGKGTTFSLYLPIAKSMVDEASAETVSAGLGQARGGQHILIIDDEVMVTDMARSMLEALGYQVSTCKDGVEGVAYYAEHGGAIDVVVLDMIMPNMGGKDAYHELKRLNPDVKVIISSGFSINQEAKQLMEAGANAYLQKPFQMDEMEVALGNVLSS